MADTTNATLGTIVVADLATTVNAEIDVTQSGGNNWLRYVAHAATVGAMDTTSATKGAVTVAAYSATVSTGGDTISVEGPSTGAWDIGAYIYRGGGGIVARGRTATVTSADTTNATLGTVAVAGLAAAAPGDALVSATLGTVAATGLQADVNVGVVITQTSTTNWLKYEGYEVGFYPANLTQASLGTVAVAGHDTIQAVTDTTHCDAAAVLVAAYAADVGSSDRLILLAR